MNHSPEYLKSESPAIELFKLLGYSYFNGSEQDPRNSINEVVLQDRLSKSIKRINPWINENNLKKAVKQLTSISASSLMEANEYIHKLISSKNFTVKQNIDGREQYKAVSFIDFANPNTNDFLVVNQMRYKGKTQNSIPDLVVYVNGLPLAVIECKSPKLLTADEDAMSDLLYYQKNSEKLFHYNQICAGIWADNGKYGAIGAKYAHFQFFKSKDTTELEALLQSKASKQDILIYNLFEKTKFLDFIRNFILFEVSEGTKIKKLPRYQQIRATNKTIKRLQETNQGGVVWHTQGSGKSITMVFIATKLRRAESKFNNPTILILTDRVDLDNQITQTFQRCGFENPIQANNAKHLKALLKDDYGKTVMTTIFKFQQSFTLIDQSLTYLKGQGLENKTINKLLPLLDIKFKSENTFVEALVTLIGAETLKNNKKILLLSAIEQEHFDQKKLNIAEFNDLEIVSTKENLFVLVDEAHRSQYGLMAAFMRKSIPNAKFIAFTGTPLDKESKSTLGSFYGNKYMDVYHIKQSVEDGATLAILYEDGLPELYVEKDLLNQQFDKVFESESEERKAILKNSAKSLSKIMTAKQRIKQIAEHMVEHYRHKVYPSGFKAMVVCYNRQSAITYKKALDALKDLDIHPFNSRVVMSFSTKKDPSDYIKIATPEEGIKKAIEDFKLPFGDESKLNKAGKKQFNNDAFLIVSDMLLTGYDVPIVQVMYLDKVLKEHTLLQAIARVNRTKTGKVAGLMVDYCGITQNLVKALEIFGGDLQPKDVMQNTAEEITRLERRQKQLVVFFGSINIDRKFNQKNYLESALHYLEPEDKRDEFKNLIKKFNASMSLVLPDPKALEFLIDFKLYNEVKIRASHMYQDKTLRVTKDENRKLQTLIDEHLRATGIQNLLGEPISIMDSEKFCEELENQGSLKSKELMMSNRIKHKIKVDLDKNPDFYKPLAEQLEELIKKQKDDRMDQLDFLDELTKVQKTILAKHQKAEHLGFKSESEFAVYKMFENKKIKGDAKILTATLFKTLEDELSIENWQNKNQVQKDIRRKIKEIIRAKVPKEQIQTMAIFILNVIKSNQ